VQLLTASATFGMAAVGNVAGFIVCRMLIGFSLATFVACQFWCSTMFGARIVGTANAVAAGWGNMGERRRWLLPMLLLLLLSRLCCFIALLFSAATLP
jgi:nitrate/nitrite transporter NarK